MSSDPKKDLVPQSFPKNLDWHSAQSLESLDRLYEFVTTECESAINWYYDSKQAKSRLGYFLRAGAIVAVAIAGVIPIIGEIYETDGTPAVSPAWATVALAVAALFVALDRFGGYTSGWVRYVRTAQRLTILQADFRLDWEEHRFSRPHYGEEAEFIKAGILLCKQFLRNVNLEVQTETTVWAQEFQQALIEVDSISRSDAGKST